MKLVSFPEKYKSLLCSPWGILTSVSSPTLPEAFNLYYIFLWTCSKWTKMNRYSCHVGSVHLHSMFSELNYIILYCAQQMLAIVSVFFCNLLEIVDMAGRQYDSWRFRMKILSTRMKRGTDGIPNKPCLWLVLFRIEEQIKSGEKANRLWRSWKEEDLEITVCWALWIKI